MVRGRVPKWTDNCLPTHVVHLTLMQFALTNQVLLPPPSIPMESHIDVPLLPSSGANTAAPLLSLPEISLEPVQMPTTPVTQSVPPVSKSPIAPFNNLLQPVTAVPAPESASHAPIGTCYPERTKYRLFIRIWTPKEAEFS